MIPSLKLKNDVVMPALGLGTWQLTGDDCINSVKEALKMNYLHIDTAQIYGNQEEVKEAIKDEDRGKLYITSKLWHFDLEKNSVEDLTNKILEELEVEYVDQLLLHWPNKNLDHNKIIGEMALMIEQGKTRSIGVSNFTVKHLSELTKENLDLITNNQVEFHPGLYQEELLNFCKENNILITAYSPLGRSEILKTPLLVELAEKYEKTPSQICLKWNLSKGNIVIPKASSKEHLEQNKDVFDFELSQEDELLIDELGDDNRLVNPDFGEFD
jgi:2,5-diketo-D-gluconate reductase B